MSTSETSGEQPTGRGDDEFARRLVASRTDEAEGTDRHPRAGVHRLDHGHVVIDAARRVGRRSGRRGRRSRGRTTRTPWSRVPATTVLPTSRSIDNTDRTAPSSSRARGAASCRDDDPRTVVTSAPYDASTDPAAAPATPSPISRTRSPVSGSNRPSGSAHASSSMSPRAADGLRYRGVVEAGDGWRLVGADGKEQGRGRPAGRLTALVDALDVDVDLAAIADAAHRAGPGPRSGGCRRGS